MSRRTSLPGADELFRSTGAGAAGAARRTPDGSGVAADVDAPERGPVDARGGTPADGAPDRDVPAFGGGDGGDGLAPEASPSRARARRPRLTTVDRRPTGRERHEEKITVYVSADELLDLEHARLTLRGEHGLAVDRGRIVREALSVVIADLEGRGEASTLVRRLRDR